MCLAVKIGMASVLLCRCTRSHGHAGRISQLHFTHAREGIRGHEEDGWCTWPAVRSTFCSSQPPMVGHSLRSSGSVDASSCPSSPGAIVMLSHLHHRQHSPKCT